MSLSLLILLLCLYLGLCVLVSGFSSAVSAYAEAEARRTQRRQPRWTTRGLRYLMRHGIPMEYAIPAGLALLPVILILVALLR